MAKAKTLKTNRQQKAYIVLRDGHFHMAFPMHVLAEGYRQNVLPGSKHKWEVQRGLVMQTTPKLKD